MPLNILRGDKRDVIVYGASLFLIAFLGINFNESFADAFFRLAVFGAFIFLAEITGIINRKINYPFLKKNLANGIIIGLVGLTVFGGISIYAQGLNLNSVAQIQSTRVPILSESKATGGLAQSFLVPVVENIVFFGQVLQITALMGLAIFKGTVEWLSPAGIFATILTTSAFVLFHFTAKIELGTTGIYNTALFGIIMCIITLKTQEVWPGTVTHILNNLVASAATLGVITL